MRTFRVMFSLLPSCVTDTAVAYGCACVSLIFMCVLWVFSCKYHVVLAKVLVQSWVTTDTADTELFCPPPSCANHQQSMFASDAP